MEKTPSPGSWYLVTPQEPPAGTRVLVAIGWGEFYVPARRLPDGSFKVLWDGSLIEENGAVAWQPLPKGPVEADLLDMAAAMAKGTPIAIDIAIDIETKDWAEALKKAWDAGKAGVDVAGAGAVIESMTALDDILKSAALKEYPGADMDDFMDDFPVWHGEFGATVKAAKVQLQEALKSALLSHSLLAGASVKVTVTHADPVWETVELSAEVVTFGKTAKVAVQLGTGGKKITKAAAEAARFYAIEAAVNEAVATLVADKKKEKP